MGKIFLLVKKINKNTWIHMSTGFLIKAFKFSSTHLKEDSIKLLRTVI